MVDCRTCHGGERTYPVPPAALVRLRTAAETAASTPAEDKRAFDHGPRFTSVPARRDIPERCGGCHADVEVMNPYGLPTDQLAQYRLSGHGIALSRKLNDKAAVCVDCHGVHEIRRPKDPQSRVHPVNVPGTCGKCHGDADVMAGSNLSTGVVEQYRASVHGEALIAKGDVAMPTCATCHGSHSAVPPGFRDVGHVCGRCHQREEQNFLQSTHGRFEGFPRCVVCHTRSVSLRDHLISRVTAPPKAMVEAYTSVVSTRPSASIDDPGVRNAYAAHRQPQADDFGNLCFRCHNPSRQVEHRLLFGPLDRDAVGRGNQIHAWLMAAEMRYAAAARRLDELQRGVLLVDDESLMLEELRTKTMELAILQHTLDLDRIGEAVAAQSTLALQIDAALDRKVESLRWRYRTLFPMWAFVGVFVSALWIKYRRLKHEWVDGEEQTSGPGTTSPDSAMR